MDELMGKVSTYIDTLQQKNRAEFHLLKIYVMRPPAEAAASGWPPPGYLRRKALTSSSRAGAKPNWIRQKPKSAKT
jgi:hypothetical protein